MSEWIIAKKEPQERGNEFAVILTYPPPGTAGGYRWTPNAKEATHFATKAGAERISIRTLGYVIEAWIVEKT